MSNEVITTQVTECALEYGINYIIQTVNFRNNIHFFYSNTAVADWETVCIWKIKYKAK